MMKTEISNEISNKKPIIFLFIMSLATGVLSAFVGHAIAAVCAGFLASLWYLETENKRILSYIASGLIIIADIVVNGLYSLVGVFAVVLGLMIFIVYKMRLSKCESVFGMTIVSAALILIAYILIGMQNTAGLSVIEFYQSLYEEYKAYFLEYFRDLYASMPGLNSSLPITDEEIIAVLDSMIGMLVSFLVIYGFALTGIGCKIFSIMLRHYSNNKAEINRWRFVTPSIYAYFYVILTLLGFFAGTEVTAFSLTVANLSNIFMVVYAYVGWSCAVRILAAKRSSIFSHLILIFAIVCFGGIAMNILSFFGVFYTITANRIQSGNYHNDNEQI
jgi:hypothetical protein